MMALAGAAALIAGAGFAAHLGSVAVVLWRDRRLQRVPLDSANLPAVTILRPLCGLENHLEESLRSGFQLAFPEYELIFCIAHTNDPAVPLVKRLIEEHPAIAAKLLIGDSLMSTNAKLNNLVKGWHAAAHDWVVMADSNLVLPPDYVQILLQRSGPGVGIVSSPPVASHAEGFAAELECGFLNSYQARWQLVADAMGYGFAQGKTLLWYKPLLEELGGLAVLARQPAEDAAATQAVRASGLRVKLVRRLYSQPLGRRTLAAVWARQLRWARLRRMTFKSVYIVELLAGGFAPIASMAFLAGATPAGFGITAGLAVFWYSIEWQMVRAMDWPRSWRSPLCWVLRDLAIPVLWAAAWFGNTFVWRGGPVAAFGPIVSPNYVKRHISGQISSKATDHTVESSNR